MAGLCSVASFSCFRSEPGLVISPRILPDKRPENGPAPPGVR